MKQFEIQRTYFKSIEWDINVKHILEIIKSGSLNSIFLQKNTHCSVYLYLKIISMNTMKESKQHMLSH